MQVGSWSSPIPSVPFHCGLIASVSSVGKGTLMKPVIFESWVEYGHLIFVLTGSGVRGFQRLRQPVTHFYTSSRIIGQ